jgi:hypothetical protein
MSVETRARRFGKLFALSVAAATLGALAIPAAEAQPYLGWDFGNGFGIGLGTPPSAYERCPNYGWWYYPIRCAYHPRRPPPRWTPPPR